MVAYIVRRTLLAAFTILVISFISFMIVQLPAGADTVWDVAEGTLDHLTQVRILAGQPAYQICTHV